MMVCYGIVARAFESKTIYVLIDVVSKININKNSLGFLKKYAIKLDSGCRRAARRDLCSAVFAAAQKAY